MTRTFNKQYATTYRELVYSIWYTNNRPSLNVLHDLLPPDDEGSTPNMETLVLWKKNFGWEDRANNTDIEVSQQTDRELIQVRIDMMKRHAKQAQEIAERAYDFLVSDEGGFDSSASAVSAWVKAVEEEKKSTGMEISLTQVMSLSDDDLSKRLDHLLGRLTNVGEVTLSKLDDEEVVDAISTEETTDEY